MEPGVRALKETNTVPSLPYWVETYSEGADVFLLFYSLGDSSLPHPELVAIERWDPSGKHRLAFRHRHLLAGRWTWSTWMPSHLKDSLSADWPEHRPRLTTGTTPDGASVWTLPLRTQAIQQGLLRSPRQALNPAIDWKPGETTWKFDRTKWTPWSGYLWEYKNGWLWKGFRKPELEGEILTPSQNQNSHDVPTVRSYYLGFDQNFHSQYTAENSRWLSPLDKWGIWASRRFGQTWWHAAGWEGVNHHTNVEWGGYCNASAAAAILWPKPQFGFLDKNLQFDPRDIAGIMQVASFKVDLLFWGRRYYGEGDDIAEPKPELFVELIQKYLGQNGTPLILDWEAGPAVGNLTLLAAKLTIEATEDPRVHKGVLALDFFGNLDDNPATKTELATVPDWPEGFVDTKKFNFFIDLDASGKFVGTRWENNEHHPDFAWLPTGNNDYAAPHRRNPYLPMKYVRELIEKSHVPQL